MPNLNITGQVSRVQLTRPITVGELADVGAWLEQRHGRDVGITGTQDDGRTITIIVDESAQVDVYTTVADIRKEHDAGTSTAADTPTPADHAAAPAGTAETPAGHSTT